MCLIEDTNVYTTIAINQFLIPYHVNISHEHIRGIRDGVSGFLMDKSPLNMLGYYFP